jgi:hypothetical protein
MSEKYDFDISKDYIWGEDGLVTVMNGEKIDTEVKFVIPETDYIGANIAADMQNLVSIDIPYGTKKIGDYAFDCSGIIKLEIPSTVNEIGIRAFDANYSLTDVKFNTGLDIIGACAFSNCRALTEISLPDTIDEIDSGAFSGITFDYVRIPDRAHLDGECFSGTKVICYSGDSINIENYDANNTSAVTLFGAEQNHSYNGSNTCEYCGEQVEYVNYIIENAQFIDETTGNCEIPETFEKNGIAYKVIGIGKDAYENNSEVKTVTIPNSVVSIGSSAFKKCDNLEAVALSENLKTIYDNAFVDCIALKDIIIPNGVYSIYGCFQGCTSLKSITLPSMISMDSTTFTDCISLENICYGGSQEEWESLKISAPAPAMETTIDLMLMDASKNLKITYNSNGSNR